VRHDDYTTVTAAAKQFGLSARHLRYLLERGIVPGIKPSRIWLVRPSAVAAYLRGELTTGPSVRRPPVEYTTRSPTSAINDLSTSAWHTIPNAATQTGLSSSHIRYLARSGKIAARKRGRDWFVRLDDLLRYRQRVRRGRPRRR
jgi:hypothetical protein